MPQIKSQGAAATPAPDDAALRAAATRYTLPSGRSILWLAPDEMEMLAFTGTLPDPLTAAVYLALQEEGSVETNDRDPASYHRALERERGVDQIIKAGMIAPRYDPTIALGDGVSVLGRRQLARGDRSYIFNWLFRLGTTPEGFTLAATDQPGGTANAPRDSEGISPDARAADGD